MSHAFIWLMPAFIALFLYGIGQGLVKKYIADVPPARFCLFFVVAKTLVNLSFFFSQPHPSPFAPEGRTFLLLGTVAYMLDGTGWILYFQSILMGPITIVGTLSAAYPALTVLFARVFLGEVLNGVQYAGVSLVIAGCIGLSYSPTEPGAQAPDRRWIPLAAMALVLWGAAQTVVKYSYGMPNASEVNLALFNTFGGALTLGTYGILFGRARIGSAALAVRAREWLHALMPMGMMAGGDLGVIVATRNGPISLVTPLTGAYPVVTLVFAFTVLKEKISALQIGCISAVLIGMYLVT